MLLGIQCAKRHTKITLKSCNLDYLKRQVLQRNYCKFLVKWIKKIVWKNCLELFNNDMKKDAHFKGLKKKN